MDTSYNHNATMDVDINYETPIKVTKPTIIEIVAIYFNINTELLKADTRRETIRLPRQIAIYLYRKHTKMSSAKIGKIFHRDHATVLHAAKTVKNMIETRYKTVASDVKHLENLMEINEIIKNDDLTR